MNNDYTALSFVPTPMVSTVLHLFYKITDPPLDRSESLNRKLHTSFTLPFIPKHPFSYFRRQYLLSQLVILTEWAVLPPRSKLPIHSTINHIYCWPVTKQIYFLLVLFTQRRDLLFGVGGVGILWNDRLKFVNPLFGSREELVRGRTRAHGGYE